MENDEIICTDCGTQVKDHGYCEENGAPYGECCWGAHVSGCEKCADECDAQLLLSGIIDNIVEKINTSTTSEVVDIFNKIFDKSLDWEKVEADESCEITRELDMKR
jgi:hypothetical protein